MEGSLKWWNTIRELRELSHRHSVESRRFIALADQHVEKTRTQLRETEDKTTENKVIIT
jgi:hypothetical protein